MFKNNNISKREVCFNTHPFSFPEVTYDPTLLAELEPVLLYPAATNPRLLDQ